MKTTTDSKNNDLFTPENVKKRRAALRRMGIREMEKKLDKDLSKGIEPAELFRTGSKHNPTFVRSLRNGFGTRRPRTVR